MARFGRWAVLSIAALLACGAVAESALAQSTPAGPSVELDRTSLVLGDDVVVTVSGFENRTVSVSVCGNEARRGTVDCDLRGSAGLQLNADLSPTTIQIVVRRPPAPCPCVVRVASRSNDEIALAPVQIRGVPTEPVEGGTTPEESLEVTVHAQPADVGVVARSKSLLGGSTVYDVTVTVKNRSLVPLSRVALAASVSRGGDDDLAVVPVSDPGSLEPGATWQQVVRASIPSPSIGTLRWEATASGAGPSVTATSTTEQRPWLLAAVLSLLVVDVLFLGLRARSRRRRQRVATPSTTTA